MTRARLSFDPAALAPAAAAGDGAAAHRLAVLTAMGLGVPHDWRRAMDLLERAAASGFEPAGEELPLLKDETGSIDLAGWLAPPAPQPLMDGPAIFAFEGFLSQWLRGRAPKR